MLNVFSDASKEFKVIINKVLEEVVDFFMEIGMNLEYDEIYADVFPLHLQEDEEYGLRVLKKIQRVIKDNFSHNLSALENYVLYHILEYVFEGTEGGFRLDNLVADYLVEEHAIEKLFDEEHELLKTICTPLDLTGICFEDYDFLDVNEFYELFKGNPEIVTDFFHIELDEYKELMPEEIYEEYKNLKDSFNISDKTILKKWDNETFIDTVFALLNEFNHNVVHTGLYKIINNSSKPFGEKQVQLLFKLFAQAYLHHTNIVILSEVDTGRGIVDFHLSMGKEHQVLLEFKLDNHNSVHEGMHYQLPTYLIAQQINFGIYVLICCKQEMYEKYKYLEEDSKKLSNEYKKEIKFFRINAIGNLKTASKIKSDEDMKL
ncbi:hypothetical protein [Bacillus cereus]|uniref:hypothetical protein n=1 Tax=Bacillus cereus TaxID=1396 RepID=UPI000BFA2733|nr:hypothetical protein [Bacillus cereus]PFO84729.1 hypothetical protein COJ77_04035 [Bacillus cereus]